MAEEVVETDAADGGIADEAQPEGISGEENTAGIADAGGNDGAGQAAPAEPAPQPERYELTAPEDFPLPEANLKSFSEACNKLGLSRDRRKGCSTGTAISTMP